MTKFDPEGLEERTDPDGFTWKDTGQHIVSASAARDAGWCADAKAIFDDPSTKANPYGQYGGGIENG